MVYEVFEARHHQDSVPSVTRPDNLSRRPRWASTSEIDFVMRIIAASSPLWSTSFQSSGVSGPSGGARCARPVSRADRVGPLHVGGCRTMRSGQLAEGISVLLVEPNNGEPRPGLGFPRREVVRSRLVHGACVMVCPWRRRRGPSRPGTLTDTGSDCRSVASSNVVVMAGLCAVPSTRRRVRRVR